MKAAILYKANTPLEVVDVQQQGPQAGEARVAVKAAGACANLDAFAARKAFRVSRRGSTMGAAKILDRGAVRL